MPVPKSPRVAMIVSTFPQWSETFLASKFVELNKLGIDAHVVCQTFDRGLWNRLPVLAANPELRSKVHRVWPHRNRVLALMLWPIALLRCLARSPARTFAYLASSKGIGGARRLYLDAPLIALSPDLVHFEFGTLARERTHQGQLLNGKLVVSFRGSDICITGITDPDHWREVWKAAHGYHFLGEDLRRKAAQRGCPEQALQVSIPPAIDAQQFDPGDRTHTDIAGTSERPLRTLSVGRLEWKKGHEDALQAIAIAQRSGLHIRHRVVGAGTYLEALSFARHQLRIDREVELLGVLRPHEVVQEMLQADVLVHSAVSEGFCNAVLEAQAMKLPVVTSDAEGLAENVVDGETGFVVPRRCPEAIASRLEQLARDPSLRSRMGEAGRRRVKQGFRLDQQADAFQRFYQELLGGSP